MFCISFLNIGEYYYVENHRRDPRPEIINILEVKNNTISDRAMRVQYKCLTLEKEELKMFIELKKLVEGIKEMIIGNKPIDMLIDPINDLKSKIQQIKQNFLNPKT